MNNDIDLIVRELRLAKNYPHDTRIFDKAADCIDSLQAQLDAAITGQETLQKAFAESQRRENKLKEGLCGACSYMNKTTGRGWEENCAECKWYE